MTPRLPFLFLPSQQNSNRSDQDTHLTKMSHKRLGHTETGKQYFYSAAAPNSALQPAGLHQVPCNQPRKCLLQMQQQTSVPGWSQMIPLCSFSEWSRPSAALLIQAHKEHSPTHGACTWHLLFFIRNLPVSWAGSAHKLFPHAAV